MTVVNGEMLRRIKLSIYEVVTPREEEDINVCTKLTFFLDLTT
jgi:hypothetical protein